MKLYQLSVLSSAFSHMFLCLGMELNLERITEYRFDSKRMLFPQPERQVLIEFCNAQLYKKHLERFNTESCQLLHQIEERQKTNLALKAHGADLLEEITILEHQVETLQKKLILVEEKKTVATPIKSYPAKRESLPVKKLMRRPAQHTDKKLSSREKLHVTRILMNQHGVREKSLLLLALKDAADRAYHKNSADFDKTNHFYRKKINELYGYIFCPCTNQMEIVPYNFLVTLPHNFGCSDRCQFYKAKNTSSSDSAIDTSTEETESESDTQEENLKPIFLSKAEIEKTAD